MAKFVSNAKDFGVFLEMTEAGGKWADFTNGKYETKNEVHAQKLRNAPNFGQDFYELGAVEEKSSDRYECPECGNVESEAGKPFDTARKAQLHCLSKHKITYKVNDIKKVEEVKVA